MRTITTLCLVAVLGLATTSNAAEIGRAISPLGDLNVVFNVDADGDTFPNYDATLAVDGFDDGDTFPESFSTDAGATFIGGDMFGIGRRPVDRSDAAYYPFALIDDSLAFFPGDTVGIITSGDDGLLGGNVVPPDSDPFFGVVDTNNPATSQAQTASWTFDISNAMGGLMLSVDMAAIGDFESNDLLMFEYSIDGGPVQEIWTANFTDTNVVVNDMGVFSVAPGTDPAIAAAVTYTLESGNDVFWDDPLDINGVFLSNEFQTFTANLAGSGSSLVLRFTALADGGSEAFAFRNILLEDGGIVVPTDNADFNGDGVVDAADYTVWRDNEGTMGGAMTNTGDANGDGNVDATDYGIWRSMFGDTVPGSLSVGGGAVPEPSTLVGISLALALGLFTRKRWS